MAKRKASKRKRKKKSSGWRRWFWITVITLSLIGSIIYLFGGTFSRFLHSLFITHETVFVPHRYNYEGALFIGDMLHGKPNGPGIMQLEGGHVLAGSWQNGKKEGLMRESSVNGDTQFTLWKDDVCVGQAKMLQRVRHRDGHLFERQRFGIDVSRYQPEYWGAMAICVKPDGTLAPNLDVQQWVPIDFVFIKASGGRADIDPRYRYHSEMADILFIPQGAYHVINTNVSIDAQIEVYLNQIQDVDLAFPPILDIEGSTKEIKPSDFARYEPLYLEWLQGVEQQTHVRPIIYCCHDFYKAYGRDSRLTQYDFWIADYTSSDLPSTCYMRQISETGQLAGWNSYVDIDVLLNR